MFRLNVWYSKLGFDGKASTLMDNLGAKPVSVSSLTLKSIQGSHKLEKYLNLEGFLKKYLNLP